MKNWRNAYKKNLEIDSFHHLDTFRMVAIDWYWQIVPFHKSVYFENVLKI